MYKKIISCVLVFVIALTILYTTNEVDAATKLTKSKKVTMYTGTIKKYTIPKAKSKVKWTVTSGKKNVKITTSGKNKKNVKIKALRKGSATIKAKYKNKSYKIKINIKNKKTVVQTTRTYPTTSYTPSTTTTPTTTSTTIPTTTTPSVSETTSGNEVKPYILKTATIYPTTTPLYPAEYYNNGKYLAYSIAGGSVIRQISFSVDITHKETSTFTLVMPTQGENVRVELNYGLGQPSYRYLNFVRNDAYGGFVATLNAGVSNGARYFAITISLPEEYENEILQKSCYVEREFEPEYEYKLSVRNDTDLQYYSKMQITGIDPSYIVGNLINGGGYCGNKYWDEENGIYYFEVAEGTNGFDAYQKLSENKGPIKVTYKYYN